MTALTLAQYETRVLTFLMDTGVAVWTSATIQEALTLALDEYSGANPLAKETVITCPAAGREIALASLSDLQHVTAVWWPYDSSTEDWPPNLVHGFVVRWDDAQPVLMLQCDTGAQPQTDDEVRVYYTVPHTLQNLRSASTTTIPTIHESLLVLGAAGYACFARSVDLAETTSLAAVATPNLAALGSRYLKEYRRRLLEISLSAHNLHGVSGPAFGAGWALDQWDGYNG